MMLATDVNPNSSTYGQTSYQDGGVSDACPLPWYSTDQSGDYYSQNCPGQIADPYPVYEGPGWYGSTVSIEDANNQAKQDAQSQADYWGTCHSVQLAVEYSNPGYDDVEVEFVNSQIPWESYTFDAPHYTSGYFRYLPSGTYATSPSIPGMTTSGTIYGAGCDGYTDGSYQRPSIMLHDEHRLYKCVDGFPF